MDTPNHAFWTYALFHRKEWWTKAVVASTLPDLPFFISSAYFFLWYGVSMEIWVEAFENPWVKPIGFFSHSLVIAVLGLAVAFYLRKEYWYPYFYGWIFHILTDIFTHVSDAQSVFWPLSEERFPGVVSYWESQYYSREFNLVNLSLESLFVLYLLIRRYHLSDAHPTARSILFGALALYHIASGLLFFLEGYLSGGVLALNLITSVLFILVTIGACYPRRFN